MKGLNGESLAGNDIAIVGMACRFPGAKNCEMFWENLIQGVDSVVKIPDSRWDSNKYIAQTGNSDVCTYCGVLEDIEQFDNSFFNISPREAISMDPQQRLLLEETWHCIEDSAIGLERLQQKNTSVFVGVTGVDYTQRTLCDSEKIDSYAGLGSFPCIIANRISHAFHLRGVSVSLDTACASSLVSIHQAKQSLQIKESDYAIASGVCLAYDPWRYIAFSNSHMMSTDGTCRAFDKGANGFVQGEGVGVLLLQRLEDAISDGNHIYGVIKGSAVNHCAYSRTITSPNVKAQEMVIQSAFENAGISPETVNYIETHGTGTSIGDPIEVEALTRVFRKYTNKEKFCKLGSVKTNIGHLASAAGVAGVIKILLMMQHKKIPANLHFQEYNPIIQFNSSPFEVADKNYDWISEEEGEALRAEVSAFGFGGVNASVVLESFEMPAANLKDEKQVFLLSAKNEENLIRNINNWKKFVNTENFWKVGVRDICRTLQDGRESFPFRIAYTVNNKEEIRKALEIADFSIKNEKKPICFYCTGNEWSGYKDIDFILSTEFFGRRKNEILKTLEKRISGIKDGFVKNVWKKEQRPLNSFLADYIIFDTMLKLGVVPECVYVTEKGALTGLVLSGILTLEEAVTYLQKRDEAICLTRPDIPLYFGNGHSIMPLHFCGKDIQSLTDGLNISDAVFSYYLNKARLLIGNQHTFTKYMEEWNRSAEKYDIDLLDIIKSGKCIDQYKLILAVAVASSIHQISSKWELSEDTQYVDEKSMTIIELVMKDILRKDTFIEICTGRQVDFDDIASDWNFKQIHTFQNVSAFFKKKYRGKLQEFDGIQELSDAIENEKSFEERSDRYTYIDARPQNDIIEYLADLWTKGININWDVFYGTKKFQRLSLPLYSFSEKAFWFSVKKAEDRNLHELIEDVDYTKSIGSNGICFTKKINLSDPMVKDHCVNGKCIVPGAAQIEMVYEAIAHIISVSEVCLCNMLYLVPIEIGTDNKKIYIQLTEKEENYLFSIKTCTQNAEEIIHSQGVLKKKTNVSYNKLDDLERLKNHCKVSYEKSEIYSGFGVKEIFYGPYFRGVERIWLEQKEALAKIVIPNEIIGEIEKFYFHPSMLDSAFQSMVYMMEAMTGKKEVFLPFSIDYICWFKPFEKNMYVHIVSQKQNLCSLSIMNEQGDVCAEIGGLFSKKLENGKKDTADRILFEYDWENIELKSRQSDAEGVEKQHVLVCYTKESKDFARQIAEQYKTDDIKELQISDEEEEQKESLKIVANDQAGFNNFFSENNQLDIIYFINNENNIDMLMDGTDKFLTIERRGILSFFCILKALSANHYGGKSLEIKVITNHALSMGREERNNPCCAEVHGIASAVAKEYKRWKVGIIDVILDGITKEQRRLLAEQVKDWAIEENGKIYALRNGLLYREKLCPIRSYAGTKSLLSEKGVYLIVGALGGIGSVLCEYLAKTYHAKLILLGRREYNAKIAEKITKLECMGASAIYVSCDITNSEQVKQAVKQMHRAYGHINGVFHSALYLKDKAVEYMDEETLVSVLNPKTLGNVVLFQELKEEALDFVLFFSSIQSYVCNAGQGNYAAASTFEDAFADYLRETGHINVKVINWAFWGSVGVVATEEYRRYMKNKGMYSITPEEGMMVIEKILVSSLNRIAVIKATDVHLAEIGVDMGNASSDEYPFEPDEKTLSGETGWEFGQVSKEKREQLKASFTILEQFNVLSLLSVFQKNNIFTEKKTYLKEEIFQKMHIVNAYRRLFDALLSILEDSRYIICKGNIIETTELIQQFPLNAVDEKRRELLQSLKSVKTDFLAQAQLVEACINRYPDILCGEVPATDVVFPNGTMDLVGNVYHNNFISDYYNALVIDVLKEKVCEKLKSIENGEKIKIVEIGAGTGGTSASVFDALKEYKEQLEYHYTDISRGFLQYGRKHFGEANPYVVFELLDIEKDLEKQNVMLGTFDIVIATNVLHATKNMDITINNLRQLLKNNGIIIVNEATTVYSFATMAFGLLDGWWLYTDEEKRIKDSPLLGKEMWRKLLSDNDFQDVSFYGIANAKQEGFGQNVIVAKSNGMQWQNKSVGNCYCTEKESREIKLSVNTKEVLPAENDLNKAVKNCIVNSITASLGVDKNDVKLDCQFTDLGIDSIISVELINEINEQLGIVLRTTVIFDYVTVNELTDYIIREFGDDIKLCDEICLESRQDYQENITAESIVKEAVVLRKPCQIEDIRIEKLPIDDPEADEVQILVKAFSLNFADYLCVKGLYPNMPQYPFATGFEVSGIVIKAGANVKNITIGMPVIAVMDGRMGGHSTVVNVKEMFVIEKPSKLTFEEAASLPAVFQTMYYAFGKINLQQGEKILIQSAAGGTGLIAVQLAKMKGAEIFACAGSEEKLTYLKKLGIQHVINYRERDFKEEILKITNGTGVDVVINSLAGDSIQKGIDLLAPYGRYVEIALAGLKASSRLDFSKMISNQEYYSIDIRKVLDRYPKLTGDMLHELVKYVEAGWIKPTVGKIFSLSQIREAFQYIQDRKNIGKIVVTLDNHDRELIHEEIADTEIPDKVENSEDCSSNDIAVIGMSCKLPGADNIEQYWENLEKGVCSINVVPKNRWDVDHFYDADMQKMNRTNCKWGGFLDQIDQFDPLFFHISGKEAELMDPQQRLLLEECWKALEDAGYANDEIEGAKCGVFVGTVYGDYITKMEDEGVPLDAKAFWGNACSVTASRISYFLNLKGPSVALETACSSSLVAIHMSCRSILDGESEMAIAGGVFINVTPRFYIMCSNAGMLSPDGVCSAFDENANGFVPGEGVGVVILKSLKAALRDRDHIYGVIKGSEINQDGRTNGITAPSMNSQRDLEISLYEKTKINPETISYVEAHGTGTKLGDPIEIEALTQAFREYTDRKQFCAIGSVKTNIGHTVAASGVSSVIKILLALQNKKIPASLNFHKCNPYIDLESSPFYVINETAEWKTQYGMPRRAVVSSFGFSGTNAHLLIEEAPELAINSCGQGNRRFYPIFLSSMTKEGLYVRIEDLYNWLKNDGEKYSLGDIAYTLSCRRKHFEIRVGIIAESKEKLMDHLKELLNENALNNRLNNKTIRAFFKNDTDSHMPAENPQNVDDMQKLSRLEELCELYEANESINLDELFEDGIYSKLSMPTYPFQRERYWIDDMGKWYGERTTDRYMSLHPLVHRNISDLYGQRFATTFEPANAFIADHVIQGKKILPGAVYLEIACIAGQLASGKNVACIRNIVWESPFFVLDSPKDIHVHLEPNESDISFKISDAEEKEKVYARGCLSFKKTAREANALFNPADYMERAVMELSGDEYYSKLEASGYHYGKTYRNVKKVWCIKKSAMSRIELPEEIMRMDSNSVLHPAVLDAVLQTVAILLDSYGNDPECYHLPFMLENIAIYGELGSECFACANEVSNNAGQNGIIKYNIGVYGNEGETIAELNGFCMKTVKKEQDLPESDYGKMSYYSLGWEEAAAVEKCDDCDDKEAMLIFASDAVREGMQHFDIWKNRTVIWVEEGNVFGQKDQNAFVVRPCVLDDYTLVFQILEEKNVQVKRIVHMWNCDSKSGQSTEEKLKTGLFSVHCIAKAFSKIYKNAMVKFILLYRYDESSAEFEAMSGFMKSLHAENLNWLTKTVGICDAGQLSTEAIADIINQELIMHAEDILISGKKRMVKKVRKIELSAAANSLIRSDGIYVITGGMGQMGCILANHICGIYGARVILTGRSRINDDIQNKLDEFLGRGYHISYLSCDVTDAKSVEVLGEKITEQYGTITGIIHNAGVINDSLIAQKEAEDIERVIAPKVYGMIHISKLALKTAAEFVVAASSLAAVIGNAGQCDYAFANAFMNAFMEHEACKNKNCRYLSVNWGLWENGGMRIEAQKLRYVERSMGMYPMSDKDGVEAFERALVSDYNTIIPLNGDEEKLSALFEKKSEEKTNLVAEEGVDEQKTRLLTYMISDVSAMMSNILKVKQEFIEPKAEMSEYGFDSISFTELINSINEKFDLDLTPATIFEYKTLYEFLEALLTEHFAIFLDYYAHAGQIENAGRKKMEEDQFKETGEEQHYRVLYTKDNDEQCIYDRDVHEETEIAIVGMSGVMPGSGDLEEFWKHLVQHENLISEVSADRWDWREFDKDSGNGENKVNCRWGGFLKEVDKFDASFFGISPREAELMDPQQRIFLETVWKTIEDAGYRASELSGSSTGIFVGSATNDYFELFAEKGIENDAYISIGTAHSVIANRISYYFNFTGPSESVDTACSSSLVAIHRAVQAILNNECEYAIAGGVNIIISPTLHISFSKAGMLSENGRCKTFDKDADGYVRGEGCAAVLLKRLNKAKEDGDHIYAVIKGSSVNHGGHVNSITTPNPNAQALVIENAVRKAGVPIDTIRYVETHGTGTVLGDPIEVNGLEKAFHNLSEAEKLSVQDKPFIGLGAVKTNIGHLEAASGIASVIKVLLSMKNEMIPANINFQELNPYIKLRNPFYIIDKNIEWKQEHDENGEVIPRRAGVSAFGFGGVNAHIILEQYMNKNSKKHDEGHVHIIVISAKTKEQLRKYASEIYAFTEHIDAENLTCIDDVKSELHVLAGQLLDMNSFELDDSFDFADYMEPLQLTLFADAINERYETCLTKKSILDHCNLNELSDYLYHLRSVCNDVSFEQVAYTLQNGREEMKERIAFTAKDFSEMNRKLKAYLLNEDENVKVYFGSAEQDYGDDKLDSDMASKLNVSEEQLAEQWVCGKKINWMSFWKGNVPGRISLPTYPFERKRYWISNDTNQETIFDKAISDYTEEEMLELFKMVQDGTVDELKIQDLLRG